MDRLSRRLLRPSARIARERLALQALSANAMHALRTRVSATKHAFASLKTQLELLNPQRTLARGYAIVTNQGEKSCVHRRNFTRMKTSLYVWQKAKPLSA